MNNELFVRKESFIVMRWRAKLRFHAFANTIALRGIITLSFSRKIHWLDWIVAPGMLVCRLLRPSRRNRIHANLRDNSRLLPLVHISTKRNVARNNISLKRRTHAAAVDDDDEGEQQ